jgi:hypothetical protein
MRTVRSLVVGIALLLPLSHHLAGTVLAQAPVVRYAAGWNMVGLPTGFTLPPAQIAFQYDSIHGYTPVTNPTAAACRGAWVYLSAPESITITSPGPGTSNVECPVRPGWNLLGNPFTTDAALPKGSAAFFWNPAAGRYDAVSEIPVGDAVWLYSASATSVDVQVANLTPPKGSHTVIITQPFQSGYQAQVGDIVEVRLQGMLGFTAKADPNYLRLVQGSAPQATPASGFWEWQAIAPGTTIIVLDPACRQSTPPCGVPSLALRLDILP